MRSRSDRESSCPTGAYCSRSVLLDCDEMKRIATVLDLDASALTYVDQSESNSKELRTDGIIRLEAIHDKISEVELKLKFVTNWLTENTKIKPLYKKMAVSDQRIYRFAFKSFHWKIEFPEHVYPIQHRAQSILIEDLISNCIL